MRKRDAKRVVKTLAQVNQHHRITQVVSERGVMRVQAVSQHGRPKTFTIIPKEVTA